MLFIFLHFLRGGNESGIGLPTTRHFHRLATGTLSNYVQHMAWALYHVLQTDEHAYIKLPSSTEQKDMEGLVVDFPKAIAFIDGTKIRAWRPISKDE